MEELLVLLIGAGVLALLPTVPALRPAVKKVMKGGLVVAGATTAAAAVAGQHWRDIMADAKEELQAGAEKNQEAAPIEIDEPAPEA